MALTKLITVTLFASALGALSECDNGNCAGGGPEADGSPLLQTPITPHRFDEAARNLGGNKQDSRSSGSAVTEAGLPSAFNQKPGTQEPQLKSEEHALVPGNSGRVHLGDPQDLGLAPPGNSGFAVTDAGLPSAFNQKPGQQRPQRKQKGSTQQVLRTVAGVNFGPKHQTTLGNSGTAYSSGVVNDP